MNKKGSVMIVVAIIFIVFAFILYILASPIINEIINTTAATSGTAVVFFIKIIPWAILLFIFFAALRLVGSGGE